MKLGAGRGSGTFCSFLHHWLPGQECVMSPIVVTGLQECGHQEAGRGRQGTWAQTRSPGTAGTEGAGKDVGSIRCPGGRGRQVPSLH